jgi:hypothetical protein
MSERTKGPWRQGCFQVYGADGSKIAHTGMGQLPPSRSQESEANAAAIVRWENHFDDLVAALDQALRQWAMYADIVERYDRTLNAEQSPEGEMYRSAKALLAKVKV